jgi:multiple sugar transport system substrate-binding protein
MINRRRFITQTAAIAAGAAALPFLDACGGGSGSGGTDIGLAWWGGNDRVKRTDKVVDLFTSPHPKVKISSQFSAWTSYWQKLNTEAAGGSLPDILQMSVTYINDYTTRGQLLDLSQYKSTLDLGDFDKQQLAQGTIQGKLTGISLGANIPAMCFNSSAIAATGVPLPVDDATWDSYPSYLSKLAKKLPSGMYPLDDGSGFDGGFTVWGRQRMDDLFTDAGKIAFTENDLKDWFGYWNDLRKAKLVVPGSIEAAYAQIGTPDAEPLVKKQAAITATWSNFISQYQVLMKDKVALERFPQSGSKAGDYVQASMMFSVSSKTKAAKTDVDFISFFIHNAKAAGVLGVERGVPGSAATRNGLKPTLKPYDAAQIDFYDKIGPLTRARPNPLPSYSGEVFDALTRASQAIALGKESVSGGAKMAYDEMQKAAVS